MIFDWPFLIRKFKINELESELGKERSRSSLSTNTLDETKSKIQSLSSRISELESVNLGLQQKLSEYTQKLDDDRFTHRSQVYSIFNDKMF